MRIPQSNLHRELAVRSLHKPIQELHEPFLLFERAKQLPHLLVGQVEVYSYEIAGPSQVNLRRKADVQQPLGIQFVEVLQNRVVRRALLLQAPGQVVCATFTLIDAVVLARAAFSHSMNYRSAVVYGAARRVDDVDERDHALRLLVDHVVPGRSATLRANTRKELAATAVIAIPLAEASVKARTGGPKDEPEDVATGTWAGVVPMRVAAGAIEADVEGPVPDDVRRRLADW